MAKKKQKVKEPKAVVKVSKNRSVGIALVILFAVASGIGFFLWKKTQSEVYLQEVKKVLNQIHDVEQEIYERDQRYSLDLESIWKKVKSDRLKLSRYAFGFQTQCVRMFEPNTLATNTLSDTLVFNSMSYHQDFYKLADSANAFFDLKEDSLDCLDPTQGFLVYAVGNRGDGVLDIWIMNHERTIGNIRPTLDL